MVKDLIRELIARSGAVTMEMIQALWDWMELHVDL